MAKSATGRRVTRLVCGVLLACSQAGPGWTQQAQTRLQPGGSFLITQHVETRSRREGPFHPRYDLLYATNAGAIAVYAGDGPLKDEPKIPAGRRIVTANYMLPAGGCVVDLIAGEALVRGPACDA